jgi:V/A-type H+-transporting ATPase subunit B
VNGGPVLPVEYSGARELRGPLLVVQGVSGVGWDEFASIRDGEEERHGLVLEVDGDLAVVQVLEGTAGLEPGRLRTSFSGEPLRIPISAGWLGRTCSGRGVPLDGGPPVTATTSAPVAGLPLNPTRREPPSEAVVTTGDEPFAVVFAGMGLTHADADAVRATLQDRSAAGELLLLLNTADDPVVERVLTPRIALTVAEHLAFDLGRHVLVVLADMTSYAEALREVSAARGEMPGRRAYPGYLYSDLASLYERCGRIRGRTGSVTVLPVLTMPAGDITHPVPDLTGYITEGQIVLTQDAHARGVYPPVDALGSLSRLMRNGAGPKRTRADHLAIAGQLLAALARTQQVRELAEVVGISALSRTDRLYVQLGTEFESRLVHQHADETRSLDETLDRCWEVAHVLPERELTMVSEELLAAHPAPRAEGRAEDDR